MNFSLRLKEERKRLKLTQKQFADIIECSATSIVMYEKEQTIPQVTFLEKIAPLGFDVQYILTGVHSGVIENTYSKEEQEIIKLYRNANESIKIATKAVLTSNQKESEDKEQEIKKMAS